MQQLNKSAHSTHTLNYHLIFCTKYRRSVLTYEIGDRVKEIIIEIAKEQNAIIEVVETEADHVHVMLNLKPTHSIPKLIQLFKGRSSGNSLKAFKLRTISRIWNLSII